MKPRSYASYLPPRIKPAAEEIVNDTPEHGGEPRIDWSYDEWPDGPKITIEINTNYRPYRGRGVYHDAVSHYSMHKIPAEELSVGLAEIVLSEESGEWLPDAFVAAELPYLVARREEAARLKAAEEKAREEAAEAQTQRQNQEREQRDAAEYQRLKAKFEGGAL